jgi:hypothetical protein
MIALVLALVEARIVAAHVDDQVHPHAPSLLPASANSPGRRE